MTIEQFHDALNLLPGDLIRATDALRSRAAKPKVHLQRWVSLAACVALLIGSGLVFQQRILPDFMLTKEAATEAPAAQAPAESPAAQAPVPDAPMEDGALSEEFAPEEKRSEVPAIEAAPGETNTAAGSTNGAHRHSYAADAEPQEEEVGYCGLTQVWITVDGETHTLTGEQAIAVTEIVNNLPYDPEQVCRCLTEYTVDTETISGIQLNLTEGFARCSMGQASLTKQQTETLREILEAATAEE